MTVMLLVAPVAHAQPPGVTAEDGVWISADQSPLFTHVLDRAPGQSSCSDACLSVWAPVIATNDTATGDGWTIETQADGRRIWAFEGKLVYRLIDTERNGYASESALWVMAMRERWLPDGVALRATELFAKSNGGKLMTSSGDTCKGECQTRWRPLAAADDAVDRDDWSVITTAHGIRAWAYGPRKYVVYEELPDAAPEAKTSGVGRQYHEDMAGIRAIHWPPRIRPIAVRPGAYDVHDAAVTKAPEMAPNGVLPVYPPASLRYMDEGWVTVQFCVGADGAVTNHALVAGSGYERLDDATRKWASQVKFIPGEVSGQPVETCGYSINFQWKLKR
jgi:TonB family protein